MCASTCLFVIGKVPSFLLAVGHRKRGRDPPQSTKMCHPLGPKWALTLYYGRKKPLAYNVELNGTGPAKHL